MSSRTSPNTEEHRPQWKWTFFWGSELWWNWQMDVQPEKISGEYHTCIYVVWSKPAPSHHQQPSQLSLLQANLLKPAAGKTCNYWLLMGNTYNGNTRCGGKTIQHATHISLSMQLGMSFQRTAGNCTWYCIQNSKWPHSVGLGCLYLYLYYTWHMPRCKGHRVIAIEMLSNKLQQILQWYRSVRHWACKAMYGSRNQDQLSLPQKSWSLWFLRMSLILFGGQKGWFSSSYCWTIGCTVYNSFRHNVITLIEIHTVYLAMVCSIPFNSKAMS